MLPVPGVAPAASRPRQVTSSMPAVLAAAFAPERTIQGERFSFKARDGLRIEGTLWRPTSATGKRGAARVPAVLYPHGGPTWQAYRAWVPFKQLLAREGFAFLDVDFRGSTGYGKSFRDANTRGVGQRRHPRHDRRGPLGRRTAVVERPARDLRRLVRRVPRPDVARRRAGDLVAPASTCTATPRSPSRFATATGRAGSTSPG